MAFFDKISAAAKSAKESANTAIEIGKLNLKIKSENDSIEQFKGQIGDLLWSQYLAGAVTDPQVLALCESIAAANSNIEALQQQVEELKAPPDPKNLPEKKLPRCWSVIVPSAVRWSPRKPGSATTAAPNCDPVIKYRRRSHGPCGIFL